MNWFAAAVVCLLMAASALACGGLDVAIDEAGSLSDSMTIGILSVKVFNAIFEQSSQN